MFPSDNYCNAKVFVDKMKLDKEKKGEENANM